MRAIAGALRDVAPAWAIMRDAAARGDISPGMDVTADLIGAIRMVIHARDKRLQVADVAAQMDLDAPPLTTAGLRMLELLHGGDPLLERAASQTAMARSLGAYVGEAMKSRPGTDMFGTPAASGAETLSAVTAREGRSPGVDPALGTQRAIATTADAADAARARVSAVEPDAAFLEAQRLAATRDFETATPTGARSAVEVLEEVEKDFMDARHAAACLIGAAA